MGLFSRFFGGKRSAPVDSSPAMVSLVVLLRQPVQLLRATIQQNLDAVFPGHFVPQNENSFVVDGPNPTRLMVKSLVPLHSGLFLVISMPGAYLDLAGFAAHNPDPQLHDLVSQHTAWLSVDRIAEIGTTEDAYRFIGKALTKLSPQDALAIVYPQRNATVPFNSETRAKLQSERVWRALGMDSPS